MNITAFRGSLSQSLPALLAATLLLQATPLAALAQDADTDARKLRRLGDPVEVTLLQDIDGATVQEGDTFDATLNHDYRVDGKVLPQNTLFHGSIQKAQESKPFSRPGYVVLSVESITLPNNLVFQVDNTRQATPEKDLHNPHAVTTKVAAKTGAAYGAINAAVTLPLELACGWPKAAALPLAFAAKMAFGVVNQYRSPYHQNDSDAKKVAVGMGNGTGVPGLYKIVTPSPEVSFKRGDTIPLTISRSAMEGLLALSDGAAPASAEEVPTRGALSSTQAALEEADSGEVQSQLQIEPETVPSVEGLQ
ncbi:MAG: hypothetical protein AB7P76_04375 [Candidatus Melainabacteria bacterium]